MRKATEEEVRELTEVRRKVQRQMERNPFKESLRKLAGKDLQFENIIDLFDIKRQRRESRRKYLQISMTLTPELKSFLSSAEALHKSYSPALKKQRVSRPL